MVQLHSLIQPRIPDPSVQNTILGSLGVSQRHAGRCDIAIEFTPLHLLLPFQARLEPFLPVGFSYPLRSDLPEWFPSQCAITTFFPGIGRWAWWVGWQVAPSVMISNVLLRKDCLFFRTLFRIRCTTDLGAPMTFEISRFEKLGFESCASLTVLTLSLYLGVCLL